MGARVSHVGSGIKSVSKVGTQILTRANECACMWLCYSSMLQLLWSPSLMLASSSLSPLGCGLQYLTLTAGEKAKQGAQSLQIPWFERAPVPSVHVHWSWANIVFQGSLFFSAALWVSLAMSKEWFGLRAPIIHRLWGTPRLELPLQWFLQLLLPGMRIFLMPELQQHRGPEWAWEVGWVLPHSHPPGCFKTSLGKFLGIQRHNQSPGSFYFTTIWGLQSSLSWKAVWVTKILLCSQIQKPVL